MNAVLEKKRVAVGGVAVLIVEDEASMQRTLQMAMERTGFDRTKIKSSMTLADARKTLETLGPFHIILLDYRLPDGNGGSLIEVIRNSDSKNAETVFMSSVAHSDDIADCMEGPSFHRLEKPFSLDELTALFDEIGITDCNPLHS